MLQQLHFLIQEKDEAGILIYIDVLEKCDQDDKLNLHNIWEHPCTLSRTI